MKNHLELDKALGNGSDMWYGRMFMFLSLFDIEVINKAIALDGEGLKRVFDLSSFKEGLNSGKDFERFFSEIPGVQEDLTYSGKSQAQHHYLVARFAAYIYFENNQDKNSVIFLDLIKFIFDKIEGADKDLWFNDIKDESDCFELLRSKLDINKS